jgi:hypothetical protein
MFSFAQIRLKKENTVRCVVESAMIYTLAVILVLVGAAASATIVIAIWGAGDGDGDNGQLRPPQLAASFIRSPSAAARSLVRVRPARCLLP